VQHTLVGCVQCVAGQRGALHAPLPAIDDEEGERVADDLPPVIDAHIHLFEAPLFEALWRWFDEHGWPVRYKRPTEELAAFLPARGVEHALALHYAHKPGIARGMNTFMAELSRTHPAIAGTATVFPGEPGARVILEEAFASGLRAVKLHCHVQCFAIDDDVLGDVLDACEEADVPLIVHAGREPKSPAYKCDPYALCGVQRTENVLRERPGLRLVVPHLGADEFEGYGRLLDRYDNLWLDTTMMLAGYFDLGEPAHLLSRFPERVMYGTDFPNIPYAWDRELRRLGQLGLSDADLARILGGNARALYGLGVT